MDASWFKLLAAVFLIYTWLHLGLEDSTWHKLTEYNTDFVMIECDLAAPPGFGLESPQWPIGCKHSISHVVLPVQVNTVGGEAMLQRSHA